MIQNQQNKEAKQLNRNPDSERNIRRIDSAGPGGETHGFQVVLSRGGRQYAKFFADLKHGGKEKARKLAREYRDQALKMLPPPARVLGYSTAHSRSNTGIKGVYVSQRKRADGSLTHVVQVSVRPAQGVGFQRSYTVKDGDVEAAIQRAALWRQEVLQERQQMPRRRTRRASAAAPQPSGERAGIAAITHRATEANKTPAT